jgi:Mn-dependent DtxR family transcriptional regulator
MLITLEDQILITLLKYGPLQNSHIAKRVGITEQWCSELLARLHKKGLVESQFMAPRRINKLTEEGIKIASHLQQVSERLLVKSK